MGPEPSHPQDIASFDLTSTHRLPTVSAAEALESLASDPSRLIPSGLPDLDAALAPNAATSSPAAPAPSGLQKGQVVEVWGPPGSGKTSLGVQLAVNTLGQGDGVLWVDCSYTLHQRRVQQILAAGAGSPAPEKQGGTATPSDARDFAHFTVPSLAHFIALLCKPTPSCVADKTSLIVIDSLSSLVNNAFPRAPESRPTPKGPGPSAAAKRLQVLQFITSSLQKLSAARDILIVILSQCATRMQSERGASLVPSINANAWEKDITTRLVVFRDWVVSRDHSESVHFIGIQKPQSDEMAGGLGPVFAFTIEPKLSSVDLDTSHQPSFILTAAPHSKRKFGDTDLTIANSEDEDYGWEEDDATQMPSMPPQWQGSEDILLGQDLEDELQSGDDASSHSATGGSSPSRQPTSASPT